MLRVRNSCKRALPPAPTPPLGLTTLPSPQSPSATFACCLLEIAGSAPACASDAGSAGAGSIAAAAGWLLGSAEVVLRLTLALAPQLLRIVVVVAIVVVVVAAAVVVAVAVDVAVVVAAVNV